ncbi:hypothetical protein SB11R_10030 [Pseudomonas oryzihabitans]|nr:hypothetical protein SB11R_10030 [Pseudomonas psychrotolerans]
MSNNPYHALIVALVLGAAQRSAWAVDAPSPGPQGITVGELSQVQSQTLLLEAMVKRAEAQQKLDHPNSPANAPAAALTYPAPTAGSEPAAAEQLPVVKLVYGNGKALHATLLFSGGYDVDATAGMDLPGGYRVTSVSLDSVVVSRNGKHYPLGFSNRAPSYPQSYASNAPRFSVTAVPMNPPAPAAPPTPIPLPGTTGASNP